MPTDRYVVGSEGMTLSRIIWNRYHGRVTRAVEQTLSINRHLADLPPELPVGTIVDVPVLQTTAATTSTVSLWD